MPEEGVYNNYVPRSRIPIRLFGSELWISKV